MNARYLPFLFLIACGGGAKEGEPCTTTDECADSLECHVHEGETEGECISEHEESGGHDSE